MNQPHHATGQTASPAAGQGLLERLFALRGHGTTARTEVIAGITTFLTMVYIVFVNPQILSAAGMTPRPCSLPPASSPASAAS